MRSEPFYTPKARFKRWMREASEMVWNVVQAIGLFILIVALSAGIMGGLNYLISPVACDNMTSGIGYPHQWTFWGGCQIEVSDGTWIPLSNYEYVDGVTQ